MIVYIYVCMNGWWVGGLIDGWVDEWIGFGSGNGAIVLALGFGENNYIGFDTGSTPTPRKRE